MSADSLLTRLEKVRQTGSGRWIARCPAHDDRTPSLLITELPDGTVLLHDFAGCDTQLVLDAVGLTFSDLYPNRPGRLDHRRKREHRPFSAEDVLRVVAREAVIVMLAAFDLSEGRPLSPDNRERLAVAAGRLQRAREVVHG